MNKNYIFILFLLVGFFILLNIEFPVSDQQVIGVYTNNNYDEEPFYAEIPYIKDTLVLKIDNTFTSNFYSNGTYEISSGLFSNYLSLSYDYDLSIPKSILEHAGLNSQKTTKKSTGKAGAKFPIQNKIFRPIKIILVQDLQYCYSKIN